MNRYKVVVSDMFDTTKNIFIDSENVDEAVILAVNAAGVYEWTVQTVYLDDEEISFTEPYNFA